MASYTTNLNLKKPAGSENVAIGDINGNMDIIDTAYAAKANRWKVPSSWSEAVTNGSMIMIAGTGIANNANVGMSLIIPVALLESTQRYWQVADAYNTGTTMTHLQCYASTSTFTAHLYYGSSQVTNESISVYYQ